MVCPHCGNETKEGAAFCNMCGTQLDAPVVSVDQSAFNAADPTIPRPSKKPSGKVIAASVAVLVIVGILFANVLMPLVSPKPWCVGTWYVAGISNTGIENMVRCHEPSSTLILDKDGSAELRLATDTNQFTIFTGTWEEDEENGSKPHTVTISLGGSSDISHSAKLSYSSTLVCNNPENAKSLSCLTGVAGTDYVFALCRDKGEVESSTWSISDLPPLDGLS
uniref:zinc-ribbon domain-containing protein n=1 Tax=Collinsella bouchesdurhonensis TaxID=1907654 RepID=UPI00359C6B9E